MIKKIFQGRLTKCKIVTEFLPTSKSLQCWIINPDWRIVMISVRCIGSEHFYFILSTEKCASEKFLKLFLRKVFHGKLLSFVSFLRAWIIKSGWLRNHIHASVFFLSRVCLGWMLSVDNIYCTLSAISICSGCFSKGTWWVRLFFFSSGPFTC